MPRNHRWSPDHSIPEPSLPDWFRLVDEQAGVLSTTQLAWFGVTRSEVRANLLAGRWQRLVHGVYATFTGPLVRKARLHAALLYGGPGSVLSHRTAAEEWGLFPESDGPVHITVPYHTHATSHEPLVVVHRTRAMPYIATEAVPPRTNRITTIVDLAVAEPSADEATNRTIELVSSTGTPLSTLKKSLILRRPYRHRIALERAIELLGGGLMSVLEVEHAEFVERQHGIPAGNRQVPFEVDGRVLWEDVAYDNLGVPLTVRLDGRRFHGERGVAFRDRRRDNAGELAGRARLVYGWHEVHDDPCGVAGEIVRVLRREGWQGELGACRRCQVS